MDGQWEPCGHGLGGMTEGDADAGVGDQGGRLLVQGGGVVHVVVGGEQLGPGRQVALERVARLGEAFQRELARGGQLYFLHNDVESIGRMQKQLSELVPDARIGIAIHPADGATASSLINASIAATHHPKNLSW